MCLILLAIQSHPAYKLVIAANRDEFYERPTAPAAFWDDEPGLLAGRDLRAGGTWLGITTKGRIAAITNYRDPSSIKSDAPSRGSLVTGFLSGRQSPAEYLEGLKKKAHEYNGFNLIVGEKHELYWYSNREEGVQGLSTGIYGVSNRLLDTPWPKVTRGKKMLRALLSEEKNPAPDALFSMLEDRAIPDDKKLPDTGVGLEWERMLSPIFITSPDYGTRSSTLLFIDHYDTVTFIERTFNSSPDHSTTVKYEFRIQN
ncbi:MAG: NRDE family protein [Deltaproteobacteria bacterium]|nr:NRDE family protein [Deltaproteobacteria bacterium]